MSGESLFLGFRPLSDKGDFDLQKQNEYGDFDLGSLFSNAEIGSQMTMRARKSEWEVTKAWALVFIV